MINQDRQLKESAAHSFRLYLNGVYLRHPGFTAKEFAEAIQRETRVWGILITAMDEAIFKRQEG